MKNKLGIIGWYGHDNYGDERMLYCIKRFFPNHEFFITNGWNDARKKIKELNNCNYVLIGGGGLILRSIGQATDIIKNLKSPFGFIGVSIEAKHKSMEKFFQIIKKKSDFILVRDHQSKKYLENHYKVIVGPDLTFLYPFDIVSEVKEDVCGLNLRDWHYWGGTLHGGYYNLMRHLNDKFPWVKKFYPFKKWDPNIVTKIVTRKFKDILPIPFYFESNSDFLNDMVVLSRYENVSNKFNINLYKNIRYLVGMRYHSIVFAIQCGIPFVSLSYQPKNETLCSDADLNILSTSIYDINDLESKIDYIKDHYDQIRKHLIIYRKKCTQEIKYIVQSICYLIN